MMLDKRSVEMILHLPDDQLVMIIKKLASDAGVDVKNLNITKEQISRIRGALSIATDDDLKRAAELLANFKSSQNKD